MGPQAYDTDLVNYAWTDLTVVNSTQRQLPVITQWQTFMLEVHVYQSDSLGQKTNKKERKLVYY